jgi:hypothetical protein
MEMTTGISAPPIGIISNKPNDKDKIVTTRKNNECDAELSITIDIDNPKIVIKMRIFIRCLKGKIIGAPSPLNS